MPLNHSVVSAAPATLGLNLSNDDASVVVTTVGTFSGLTFTFQVSDDGGTTWETVQGYRRSNGAWEATPTASAPDSWVVPLIPGTNQKFQISVTALTSGNAGLHAVSSPYQAPSEGGGAAGGGGGSGTSTIVPSTGALTDRSGTITAGGTSQQLAAANAVRKYLLIQNLSTGDLWFNFGVAAVVSQPSIKLMSNATIIMEDAFVSNQAVNIIGATTGQAFAAKEG